MKVRPWRTSSSRVASLRGTRTSSSSQARHMPDAPLWRILRHVLTRRIRNYVQPNIRGQSRRHVGSRHVIGVNRDLPVFNPSPSPRARQDGRHGAAMVRSEGLLACVVLLLSVPTVATLQLPRAAGPGLRPGPHASRAQRQQLSRGDVLRGALAVAATWASPPADSVRPARTGRVPFAHRTGLLRALSAEAQGFVTVPALGVPYRTHTQPTLSGAPRVPPLAGRAGTDAYHNPDPNQNAGLATGWQCG